VRDRINWITDLRNAREGPSWRPNDFVRFEIGKLPDGREEWLEFWVRNHLLPDYVELASRKEIGVYGGETISFLSLADLLRSKETERESDWADIALLEEIQDARNLSAAFDRVGLERFLSELRSRRGFERGMTAGCFADRAAVERSATKAQHPVAFAFLAPLVKHLPQSAQPQPAIDSALLSKLFDTTFGDARHLAMVEIVRRGHKRRAMETDRQDKQDKLRRNSQDPP
jgi:hypothetical protein